MPAAFAATVGGAAEGDHEDAAGQVGDGAEHADTAVLGDAGGVDQAGHPEGDGVHGEHHGEVDRHHQPDVAVAEDAGERSDRLALFFAVHLAAQAGFLLVAEPADVLEAFRQLAPDQDAEQGHRQALDEEHPLPATHAEEVVETVEDPTRQRPADYPGHGNGNGEQSGHLATAMSRKPAVDVDQDAGEETGFGHAEEQAQGVEAFGAGDLQHGGGKQAPDHHQGGDPATRADALQHQVAGHAEDGVGDEEQAGAQAVDGFAEVQVAAHLQLGEADIDAVEVGEDVADQQ
ncbi:hypothetical protein D9M70_437930 [compost metagenome]